jgi:CRP/FNR family transcriptional regulator, cyclic AMP receptor protein
LKNMAPGRIALLQSMPVFGALRDDALECLLEGAPTVTRAAGEHWFREGDAAQCMYVIEQGAVEVQKRWDGSDWPLHQLHAGDCFGEMALMDFFPRSASVRAVEDCRAIEIGSDALQRLAERDMEQFALIQMNIGREVCRRLRATDELLFRLRRGEALQADAGPTLI